MRKYTIVLLLAILGIIFFILSHLVGSYQFKIDAIVNNFGQSIDGNLIITRFFIIIAWLGDVYGVIIMALLVSIYLFVKKSFHNIIFLISSLGVTAGTIMGVKYLVARARPENMIMDYHGYSFPSGHATMAIVFYGLLLFLFLAKIHSKILRILLILGAIIMSGLIMFSRIYLSVHWFTDVIGGALLGTFFLVLSMKLYRLTNSIK